MSGPDEVKEFTRDELNEALYHIEDITQRCIIPFVLLDETARSIVKDGWLKGDRLTIGVRAAELTAEAKSTLRTLASPTFDLNLGIKDFQETDKGFSWNYRGIPIEIKVIQRNYEFIKNPDFVNYWGEMWNVPNPFDKYYKARNIVQ